MMTSTFRFWAGTMMLALVSSGAFATELIYTPVNPTFGGNPLNAAGLLANANAQNDYKAPVVVKTEQTELEKFNEQVQAAILAKIRTNVGKAVDTLLGNGVDKTTTVGNYVITYKKEGNNVVIITEDTTIPGSSTRMVLGTVASMANLN
jgi:curli production assembly/transport component CsgF